MPGRTYQRGDIWWIAFSHKGKEYRHSAKTESRREAEKVLSHYLGLCAREEFKGFEDTRLTYTVGEMLDDLVDDCTRRGLRAIPTVERRIIPLRKKFGTTPALDLNERMIDLYIKERLKTHAQATVHYEMVYLKQSYRIARRKKLVADIPYVPSLQIDNPRQGFFEHSDFLKVVENLPDHLKDFIRFAYYSGWRKSEIMKLEWRDVQGSVIRLRPTMSKNKEGRVLAIVGEIANIINRRQLCQHEVWVFHRDGRPLKDFRKSWKKACTLAGVPEKFVHDFRRTAVRNLTRAGVPEKVAMDITGHKTRSVFDKYNITNEDDIRDSLVRTFAYLGQNTDR